MIALFNMLVYPLGILPSSIIQIYKCMVSFKRMNKLYKENEIDDTEIEYDISDNKHTNNIIDI